MTVLVCAIAACGGGGAQAPAATSAHTATASAKAPPLDDCIQPSDHAREVVFKAGREQLVGAEFGSGSVGVVLAHEYFATLCGWVSYAEHLRDVGDRALAFDFGSDLVADVTAAATQLRQEGATKVVLMGASMGATASLVAATTTSPTVAGVASLSGPSYYQGLNAQAAAAQLTIPVLFMDAAQSRSFPENAKAMYATCPSPHKKLVLLPGTDHGTQLLHFTVAAQAQAALDTFVASATA